MCGRYVSNLSKEEFEAIFHMPAPAGLRPRYNIAPTQEIFVFANVPGQGPKAGMTRWGFPSTNTPADKKPSLLINARAETVHKLPTTFRPAFDRGHRLVRSYGLHLFDMGATTVSPLARLVIRVRF